MHDLCVPVIRTDASRLCVSHIVMGHGRLRASTIRLVCNAKVSQMTYSRQPKGPIRRKSLKNPSATSPKLTRRSTTSMVAPILRSQGRRRNSQPGRSWRSQLPPPSNLSGPRSPSPSTVVTTRTLC
jgi:hypothetical protein